MCQGIVIGSIGFPTLDTRLNFLKHEDAGVVLRKKAFDLLSVLYFLDAPVEKLRSFFCEWNYNLNMSSITF